MNTYFNGSKPRKGMKSHTAKPIMFRGELWLAKQLAELPEAELGEASIRIRLNELEDLIRNGDERLSDERIITCVKKTRNTKNKNKYKKETSKKDWDLLNSLWK